MKITKSQLKQIIKEELSSKIDEMVEQGDILERLRGVLTRAASDPSDIGLQRGITLALEMIDEERRAARIATGGGFPLTDDPDPREQ